MTVGINVEKDDGVSDSPPMDSPWPMQCFDTHHTSRSPYSTSHIDGLEKWRYFCYGSGVDGGIVLDDEGNLYFGDKWAYVHSLNPDGTLRWKYRTEGWITGCPALAEDGTLYVGSWDDYLYAINPDGTRKWTSKGLDVALQNEKIESDKKIKIGTISLTAIIALTSMFSFLLTTRRYPTDIIIAFYLIGITAIYFLPPIYDFKRNLSRRKK